MENVVGLSFNVIESEHDRQWRLIEEIRYRFKIGYSLRDLAMMYNESISRINEYITGEPMSIQDEIKEYLGLRKA